MVGPSIDDRVRQLCEAERSAEATAAVIERHGPEIMGLLVALAGDESMAADAYSLFCERVWRALPAFRFESSLRTWAYVLARRSMVDARRARDRGPRLVAASPSQLPEVVEQARSSTRPHLRSTIKQELRALRVELDEDDQLLLVLRIDRELPWQEIARVLSDEEDPDAQTLKRTTATLRKRFERAKARLSAALLASRGEG